MKLTPKQTQQLKACRSILAQALDLRIENPSDFDVICLLLKQSGDCTITMRKIIRAVSKTLTDLDSAEIEKELNPLKKEMYEILIDDEIRAKHQLLAEKEPRIVKIDVQYNKKKTFEDVKVGETFDQEKYNYFNDVYIFGIQEPLDKKLFTTSIFKKVKRVEETTTYFIEFSDQQKLTWTSDATPEKLAEIEAQFEQKMAELQTDSRPALTC